MRTISSDDTVRLYHLGDDGVAGTLFYGPLGAALAVAAGVAPEQQDELYIQTSNDVIGYRDLVGD